MAARVIWSPEAADGLEQVVEFIARDSPRYARQVAADVLEAVEAAPASPGAGPRVSEIDDPDVRQIRVYSYRVIYRVKPDAILIAAIVHSARDLRNVVTGRRI